MAHDVDKAELRAALSGRSADGALVDPVQGEGFTMTEARRVGLALGAVKARAVAPDVCSPAIPVAPARGPMAVHRPVEAYMTGSGPRVRREPMPGGVAARVVSPLEVLELASRRRDGAALFTVAQHVAAAEYVALVERVASGRVKCSDLVGVVRGGAGSVMDAIVHDIGRLRRMDEAIGREPVLAPRGRAVAGRLVIRADLLVHWALIRCAPLSGLLARRGWCKQAKHRERLQAGLAAALDRLHGL